MIFDQFSRYKACTNFLHQAGLNAHCSVLDVGSGPECFLGEFIPEAKITYVDPLIENNSELNRIKGNVFARDLDEQHFDYVTAIDVLEHVPPENRHAFFERLSVLGTHALVIGFPSSDTPDANTTDYIIDSKYRDIFGHDYPWLEEHHRYGLPSLNEALNQLVDMGWHCQSIGHGHVPWLQELLGFVVCAWDIPNLKKIVLDISDTFNRELYPYDFRPPHYRHFIIASRNPLPAISAPSENETGIDSDVVFQTLMKDAYQQYFNTSMRQLANSEDIADERDAAVAERDAAVAERDAAVAERDGALAEREGALAERDAAVAERDAALAVAAQLKSSKSWRLTKPMRFVARLVRFGFTMEDRQWVAKRMRTLYHQLPLSPSTKKFFSFVYHKLIGRVLISIHRTVQHRAGFQPPAFKPTPKREGLPDYIVWGVIDWHFRHQRPQQLALAIGDTGRRVFYVSPNLINDERHGFEVEVLNGSSNLFQIMLFAKDVPDIYSSAPILEIVNQLRAGIGEVLDWADCEQLVSLVQHPFWCDAAAVLPNCQLVYDCMDHHAGFGNTGETLVHREKDLFCKSDLTITTSDWLDEAVAEHTRCRALIRNAGDYDHFSKTPENVYRDSMGRRIIGYYGAIAEWFDLDLVASVAKRHTECCVMLIGADSVNAKSKLGNLPNVIFTGEVPYSKLPYYLYGFDVCLLPFKIVPLTLATNPVKAYEYLSAGKPIVSVSLPEIVQFDGLVYVAADQTQFLDAVDKVLAQPESKELIQRRKDFAKRQTWKHRTQTLIQCVESKSSDPKVSLIIVTYNNLDLTRECLASIDAHSQYDNLEVIVVDNASTDGSPAFLERWASVDSRRMLILNSENRGFAAANNQGLNLADGDFLVILNNDTYVTPGWVRTLMGHLRRDNNIGMVGPVTNNIGNEAKIDISYGDMNEMLVVSAAYTRRHIGKTYPLRTTAFFCAMMSRETFDQVGLLDEAFGRGFFEDDDYCRRIEKTGRRVVCAEDVFIHHYLSASFDQINQKDRQELFEENKKIYEGKWGEWLPHGYRNNKEVLTGDSFEPTVPNSQQHFEGQCNVCGKQTRFFYEDETLWRESLNCEHCRTTSRYRSIARGILRAIKDLTGLDSPSIAALPRSSKKRLHVYDTQPSFYNNTCAYPLPDLLKAYKWMTIELSQYKPERRRGEILSKGKTNQNLECLTFADESLDIVITSDVMEHVRLDNRAHKEIYRVLKPGGIYIFTVPHCRDWDKTLVRVQVIDPDDPSKDVHQLEPEYHGDTNSDSGGGVLSYRAYGRDLEDSLSIIGFKVEYSRKDIETQGILNTELYYCRKIASHDFA